MSRVDPAPDLAAMFAALPTADPAQRLQEQAFTEAVLARTEKARRHRVIRRIIIGLMISLLAIPGQDIALALTQVMLVTLVELEDGLISALLAPINSVGSLVSFVLLWLRLVHNRIFR